MAARIIASWLGAWADWGAWTACRSATRLSGMLLGDVISAAAFGTKENPVTAPPTLRLTSAVICCHRGRPAEGNEFTPFLRIVSRGAYRGRRFLGRH